MTETMTNGQILKKAIEKANFSLEPTLMIKTLDLLTGKKYYELIFSHDFAKAFWSEPTTDVTVEGKTSTLWHRRLQEMVLEEQPLKYLEKFL